MEVRHHERDDALTNGRRRPIFGTVSDPAPDLFTSSCPHPYTTSPTGIPREGDPAPRVGAWVAFLVTSEGRRLVPISEVPAIQRGDAFSTLGPPEGGVIGWKVYGGISPTADSPHYEVRWVDAEAQAGSAV